MSTHTSTNASSPSEGSYENVRAPDGDLLGALRAEEVEETIEFVDRGHPQAPPYGGPRGTRLLGSRTTRHTSRPGTQPWLGSPEGTGYYLTTV